MILDFMFADKLIELQFHAGKLKHFFVTKMSSNKEVSKVELYRRYKICAQKVHDHSIVR